MNPNFSIKIAAKPPLKMKNHTNEWVRTRRIKRKVSGIDGSGELLRDNSEKTKKINEKNKRRKEDIVQFAFACRDTTYPCRGTKT